MISAADASGRTGREAIKVVVVMPPGSRFSALRPTSIETVVRSLALHSADELIILCDGGAERSADLNIVAMAPERSPVRRAKVVLGHVERLRPDLVEIHQHMPSAAALAKRLNGIPTIMYRHNLLPPAKMALTRWRHRRRARLFDGHVFVSETGRQEFADRYPDLADRAVAVTNAIDMAAWVAPASDRSPIIAFAGRAAPEKGLGPLCEALGVVLSARPDWRAELALRDWTAHRAWSEAQLTPLAKFGGRVAVALDAPHDAVRAVFQRAAIVVVPSLWREPFGLVAIEAHAAGAAVVSSGEGGLAQASGGHARIVPAGDDFAARLAEALLSLIDDPVEREAMAGAGQRFTAQAHDAADRSRQLDEVRRRVRGRAKVVPHPAV